MSKSLHFKSHPQIHHRMKSPMARDQPPYHGVRQHRWGIWISEIDHPILNVKIWLGTFDTEEKAARAYDEAARLMCRPRVKTNFPPNRNSTSLLADDIRGNLCRIVVEAKEAMRSCRSADEQLIRSGNREGRRGDEFAMKSLREEDVDEMIKELLYDDASIELRL